MGERVSQGRPNPLPRQLASAGRSEDGAFYLTQAMGGGKTHSLIAFGLLATDPALRREVVPNIAIAMSLAERKL
jgi:hypothetical protein